MEQYYSKVDNTKLLHIICRKDDFVTNIRKDIVPVTEFIQCSMLFMEKNKTFKPHKHIWKHKTDIDVIAQESWIVISGSVECTFYDLDDTELIRCILYPGDASFTLLGGHTYTILEDNTLVYEYKTGPYEGQHLDKVFIDEK